MTSVRIMHGIMTICCSKACRLGIKHSSTENDRFFAVA